MLVPDIPNPLIVIVGPTAVGKSSLAIALAQSINGEIVSADSCLFYRGMDIGTAKPCREDLQKVPHHLVDVTDPDHPWSFGIFQDAASWAISDILARGRNPILVGGTGQYIRAIVEGWQPPVIEANARFRDVLEDLAGSIGKQALHHYLEVLDLQAAASIDYRNGRRTIRALEVIFTSGVRFSLQRRKERSPYSRLMIGLQLPRIELYERIDKRIDAMISAGLVEEVRDLLTRGYPADLAPFAAIGYREMIAHLQGAVTLGEAIILIRRNTRRFVRRQANWFPPDSPDIHWLNAGIPDLLEKVLELIRNRSAWIISAP